MQTELAAFAQGHVQVIERGVVLTLAQHNVAYFIQRIGFAGFVAYVVAHFTREAQVVKRAVVLAKLFEHTAHVVYGYRHDKRVALCLCYFV